MRKLHVVFAAVLLLFVATACGDDDSGGGAGDDAAAPTVVNLTAKDYTFELPATIEGGTIELNYKNDGAEPHFAAFAKAAAGKTFADVKAALTAPPGGEAPAGPPPFTEEAGAATVDPGGSAAMTFDLEAGTYALFCALPSPDGVPHAAKGMVVEVTVTEGEPVAQPDTVGTITGKEFALSAPPEFDEGDNVVGLTNDGTQLHEINLVELQDGKTVEDLVAWEASGAGPPPGKFLSGVAVAPGSSGTSTFDFKSGSTYVFVCLIPDSSTDFKSHLSKGMKTDTFTI